MTNDHAQLTYLQQALALHPHDITLHNKLGILWQQLGHFTTAIEYHQQAIHLAHALFIPPASGGTEGGSPESAQSLAYSYNNLGLAQQSLGQLDEAIRTFQQAIQVMPHLAEAHYNLGNIWLAQHQFARAIPSFQQALNHKPNYIKACHNLGLAYQQQGQWAEAEQCYQQVIALTATTGFDSRVHAWHNLGNLYQQQNRLAEATAAYQDAIALLESQPLNERQSLDLLELYNHLGNVWLEQQQLTQAIACFERAECEAAKITKEADVRAFRDPSSVRVLFATTLANLGAAYHKMGQVDEAIRYFEQALQFHDNPILRLRLALTLPIIYPSLESLTTWRQRLESQIETLCQANLTFDLTSDIVTLPTNFLAAYQGHNDRDLQAKIASIVTRSLSFVPGQLLKNKQPMTNDKGQLTIGFISAHFKHHTVGKLMQGLIAKLPRPDFKVIVFSIGHHTDEIATFIRHHADEYITLSSQLEQARQQILAQPLDLLFYADIGMEPFSYALGLSRLAPVQCVTWGHSMTTGLPEMDYYLSSELYETAAADQHYTEKLIRLKSLNTYFYRPSLKLPLLVGEGRGEGTIYLCPQSLYKYHPDFDELLGQILRRDPQGQLWLLSGQQPHWNELLWQRFQITMPDVLSRVKFVPRQDQAGFLQLLTQADIILDPPHFGGCNSSLEAFAFGLPIVAMPSQFLRGRFTAGFYQAMGLSELIAHTPAEYVNLAVRLGSDITYRQQVNAQILAANHVLYENMAAVDEMAAFFKSVCQRSASQSVS